MFGKTAVVSLLIIVHHRTGVIPWYETPCVNLRFTRDKRRSG